MQFNRYTVTHGLKVGALGGVVGALVLGVLAGISAFILDQEVFYVTIAQNLGLASREVSGWALLFAVAIIAGSLFIATTSLIQRFALYARRKSFWVELPARAGMWIVDRA